MVVASLAGAAIMGTMLGGLSTSLAYGGDDTAVAASASASVTTSASPTAGPGVTPDVSASPTVSATPSAIPSPSTSPSASPEPSTSPTASPIPDTTGGWLSWGIKASFRDYVRGPIAQGVIETTGATEVNGAFRFEQVGGSLDLAGGTGIATYSGQVRFYGHAGELDVTFADPAIRLIATGTAALDVTVNGERIAHFATVDVSGGLQEADGVDHPGAVTITAAAATLTEAGVDSFLGFYPAGAALDPVTVVVGTPQTTQPTPTQTPTSPTSPKPTSKPTTSPDPAPTPGATGQLVWGVHGPFRSYVTGPIARGSIVTTGVTLSGGAFVFTQTGGSLDASPSGASAGEAAVPGATLGTGSVNYGGAVHFVGHNGELDLRLSSPSVRVTSATSAALDITINGTRVRGFATVDLASSAVTTRDGVTSVSSSPVTLQQPGVDPFQGFYPAGTALDPMRFTVGSAGRVPSTTRTVADAEHTEPSPAPSPSPFSSAVPDDACLIDAAELTWAFKDEFLAYLDSSIANGSWEVSGGAHDTGAAFTWSMTSGYVDSQSAAGVIAFGGAVTFDGHGGILHTTIANPRVEITDAGTYLLLDVDGERQDGVPVSATGVRFALVDATWAEVQSVDGVLTLESAPATLTEAGAEAFGTYPAGEALAPVTVTMSSAAGCLDVLASAHSTPPPGPADPTPGPAAEAEDHSETSPTTRAVWVLWVVAGLITAAITTVVVVKARQGMIR